MRRRTLAALIALLSVGSFVTVARVAGAQDKRPMSVNDLLTAVRVGDPQLSPDGRRVLYTRTTTEMPSGARNADIWTVLTDGSAPAALFIGGPKSDNSPRFIPGGTRVAFISSRDGAPQIYVADADGTGARAITSLSGGVQPPFIVSPDGKLVAFVSDAYPSCADEACNKATREAEEGDPVKVHTLDRLPFRHWDSWWERVRHHVFVTEISTGTTRDVTLGDFDSPPHNYEDGAIAFSPDSREIAFVSKRDGVDSEMWSTNHEVWVVSVSGGAARKVTTNPAADMQPTFSPDGRSILVRAQRRAGFEADRWYIDAYDRTSGAKRTVFVTPDLSVDDFKFAPDGTTLWFTATSNATANLYTVPASGGAPVQRAQGGAIGEFQLGSGFAVFSKSTLVSPSELFRVSADGSTRPLTKENASWLAAVDLPRPTSRTVTGAAGASVQYWLLTPPHFDATRKYPVVFMIHGGPQGSWADSWSSRWNPSLWAAQGWVVAAPNPRGSTGFGQEYVDQISQDWCGQVMTDLEAVFGAVSSLPYVDATRSGVAGASYGGYAVDWLIGHTDRFKVAVSHDGVFNLESMAFATEELWFTEWEFGGKPTSPTARANFAKCSPHLSADAIRTPTLVITNEQDFRVPVDQGLQLFTALRRNGVPSRGLVFPDEGHWVLKPANSLRWHNEVFTWITDHIGTGPAPTP